MMKRRNFALVLSVMILLSACTTPLTAPETTTVRETTEPITTSVTAPETEPSETQNTEPQTTELVTEPVTTPETQNTEPTESTEPEPMELTFSEYSQGTTNLKNIASDEGITISVDDNHYFEFPGYPGIKFFKKMEAIERHFDCSVTFECLNGEIETIEILGSDKKTRIGPDGTPIESIHGSTVPGKYALEIGYWYLRLLGTSDTGEKFQVLLIAGTR